MATDNDIKGIDTRWAHRIIHEAITSYPEARGSVMPSACQLLFDLSFSFTTLQNTPESNRTRQKALDHALYAWYEHTKRRNGPVKPRELRMLMSWLMHYNEPREAITGLIFVAKGIRRLHAMECQKQIRSIAFTPTISS